MKIIVSFSGGKDSQACLIQATNKYEADKIEAVFCDTDVTGFKRITNNKIEMNKVHICETCKYCTHSPNLFQPYYWCSWYGKEVRTPINKCDKIVLKINQK